MLPGWDQQAYFVLYLYQKDGRNLVLAANKGCSRAIEMLTQIADTIKNSNQADEFATNANYELRLMYLNGQVIKQDKDIAKQYLMNAYHTLPEAGFILIQSKLVNDTEESLIIDNLIKSLSAENIPLENTLDLADRILNLKKINDQQRYTVSIKLFEIITVMMHFQKKYMCFI